MIFNSELEYDTNKKQFDKRLKKLEKEHKKLITSKNRPVEKGYNGIYYRYKRPVLTAAHVPLDWRYDLNYETNPFLMQRIGVNATFNSGALYLDGRYLLMVRVEGWDRKSFFAVAESANGIDNWQFWGPSGYFKVAKPKIPTIMCTTCVL